MNYTRVSILCDAVTSDIMVALLGSIGYEGFEEELDLLHAYIAEDDFDQDALNEVLTLKGLTATLTRIEKTNWNKTWEENFFPVVVEDFCTVRADFHEIGIQTQYEIIITPKMSFGTGHHSTTQLMIESMRDIDFRDKVVLDFGTGTGILAILASMMHATKVIGIDNEDWACENAIENVARNDIHNIDIIQGSLETGPDILFDVILANINRHILLDYMIAMYTKLCTGGCVIMSGILEADEDIVVSAAIKVGLKHVYTRKKSNWLILNFLK